MVLDELLDDRVVILVHLTLLGVVGSNQLVSLLGREIIIGRSEDGEHLTAVQCLVVAASLNNLGKVAQVAVL